MVRGRVVSRVFEKRRSIAIAFSSLAGSSSSINPQSHHLGGKEEAHEDGQVLPLRPRDYLNPNPNLNPNPYLNPNPNPNPSPSPQRVGLDPGEVRKLLRQSHWFLLLREEVGAVTPSEVGIVMEKVPEPDLSLRFLVWAMQYEACRYGPEVESAVKALLLRLPNPWPCLSEISEHGFRVPYSTLALLVNVYIQKGHAEAALNAFYKLKSFGRKPGRGLGKALMGFLVKADRAHDACAVYESMVGLNPGLNSKLASGVGLDSDLGSGLLLVAAVTAYSKAGRLDEAVEIVRAINARGFQIGDSAYTPLIAAFGRNGEMSRAFQLLDELLDKGIPPSVFAYNAVISSLCKTAQFREAFMLLREMREEGCPPDFVTYNTIIGNLYRASDNNLSILTLLSNGLDLGVILDIRTYNGFLSKLCKVGEIAYARQLLSKMLENGCAPQLSSFNIILSALFKLGDCSSAADVFHDLVSRGFCPDAYTCTIMVGGYCKAGEVDKALVVFDDWAKKCDPTKVVVTYNMLIDSLCRLNRIEDAKKLIQSMTNSSSSSINCSLNFNALLTGLCRVGEMEEAEEMLNRMISDQTATVVSHNILLDGYCKIARVSDAYRILERMLDQGGVAPDIHSYNTILAGVCRIGKIEEAKSIFEKMAEKGIVPDIVSYNTLLDCLCKSGLKGEVVKLLEEMVKKGHNPDNVTYGTLLAYYARAGKWEKAHKIFLMLKKKGYTPTLHVYNPLILALCKAGEVDKAKQVYTQMTMDGHVSAFMVDTLHNSLIKADREEEANMLIGKFKEKRTDILST